MKTNFFKIENNFAKMAHVPSIPIIVSELDFLPKITIAIPTYKRSNLLKAAIESAIDQAGYTDYDILIVDNDPKRNCKTEQLVISYNNSKISYYKNSENIGSAGNWNRLFELAKGEWVIMLHDDDLLLPTFIIECIEIIKKKKDLAILKPEVNISYDSEININDFKVNTKENRIRKTNDYTFYNTNIMGSPSGCLFNKEKVIQLGGFNQDFYPYMDLIFTALCAQNYSVYYYYKKLSICRILENDSLNLSTLLKSFEGVYYFRRELLKKYRIPNIIIDYFLACNLVVSISAYKKFNKEFVFDITSLGLKRPTKMVIILYLSIVKLVNFILWITTLEKI